jgi:hypothetical protein
MLRRGTTNSREKLHIGKSLNTNNINSDIGTSSKLLPYPFFLVLVDDDK